MQAWHPNRRGLVVHYGLNQRIERSTVVRWEAGKTVPLPWVRPMLAQTLQVSDEQLDDLLRPNAEGDDAAVDRRAFTGLATALALAPLARARTGSQIGSTQVRQLQVRTARLRRLDDHLGGMDTYGVYVNEVAATEKLIKSASYSSGTARALTGVLAEQAQMAGWAAFDAGRYTDSRRHYRLVGRPRVWRPRPRRQLAGVHGLREGRQPDGCRVNPSRWCCGDASGARPATRAPCVGLCRCRTSQCGRAGP
jgi:hypothetical protein